MQEVRNTSQRVARIFLPAPRSYDAVALNWLQVLGTTELAQIYQRVCQQLHALMPLLYTFKS